MGNVGASEGDGRPSGPSTGAGDTPSSSHASWVGRLASQPRVAPSCLAWLKMCRELQRRIPDKAFKEVDVTYVPGAAVGREKRRMLVHRLQVQHAVCMLMNLRQREELFGVEEAFRLLGQKKGQAVFRWAKERALEQELSIFGHGKGPTPPVYASLAGKLSALDWWEARFQEGSQRINEEDEDGGSGTRHNEDGGKMNEKGIAADANNKRKRDLEECELDFEAIRERRRSGMHKKLKPVIMELIDEQMVGSLAPERKLDLLEHVQAMCDKGMTPQTTLRCDSEQLRAMLAPIVLKATEPIRHVQKLQYTKM